MTRILRKSGFTLTELLVVIVVIAIVAAVATHRLAIIPTQAANVSAIDQAAADIQYTQQKALAARSDMSIVFTAGVAAYTMAGEMKNLPTNTAAGNSQTFTFNSFGELLTAGPGIPYLDVVIGGRTIRVYRITGKVSIL